MNDFYEGYKFFCNIAGVDYASQNENKYIYDIESEINKTVKLFNDFEGCGTDAAQLKGNIAELYHAGTYNVKSVVNHQPSNGQVLGSNKIGSIDIVDNDGTGYSLKYYADAIRSAKEQSKSYFERYKEYLSQHKEVTFEEYLSKNKIDPDTVLETDPLYNGQVRIIPKDQLAEAVYFLKRKLAEESIKRPELAIKYEDTLNKLSDKIKDSNGVESIPLTKEEAYELAKAAKKGDINAEKLHLTTEELIDFEDVLKDSLDAGITAAVISTVLKTAPLIYQAIDYLIETGEVDEEKFQEIGFEAIKGSAEGFIRGTVAAALTMYARTGMLGSTLKTVSPSFIGAFVTIAINTMHNAFLVSNGKMKKREMINLLVKDMFIAGFSVAGGEIAAMILPVPIVSYLIGSFVGSVIGAFAYKFTNDVCVSLCVSNGYTIFGLVEQTYELPEEILKKLGLETIKIERFKSRKPKINRPNLFYVNLETIEIETIELKVLKRGVIGVNKVGYVLN